MCAAIVGGILLHLILGRVHCLTDAAQLEVEIGQAILQVLRGGIGAEGELVLLDRLGGVVRAAVVDCHLLIEMGEAIVIVGGGVIRLTSDGGCCRNRVGLQRL